MTDQPIADPTEDPDAPDLRSGGHARPHSRHGD